MMRYAILQNYEQRAVSLRTSDVQTQLNILANHLINYRYLQGTASEAIEAELSLLSNLYDGRVLIINSNLKVVKDTYGISGGKTIISEEVIRCLKGENTSQYDPENNFIEMTVPIMEMVETDEVDEAGKPIGPQYVVRGVMLTSVSTDYIAVTLDTLNRKALVMEAIVLLAILSASILASYVIVRPFEKITNALNQVKAGYSNEPISVPYCLET
ncbi:MAG: two-component sensor histidine kinase, partial [Lachnospiraceae bacterium]|nr:two-component sensor histidine kinase [Lachnospiraceae bacterium]